MGCELCISSQKGEEQCHMKIPQGVEKIGSGYNFAIDRRSDTDGNAKNKSPTGHGSLT